MTAFVRGVIFAADVRGVQREVVRAEDVREHGRRAAVDDRRGGGGERHRGHDHLVAGPDARGQVGEVQRGRAGGDGDRVLGAEVLRERALELGRPRAHREPARSGRRRAPPATSSSSRRRSKSGICGKLIGSSPARPPATSSPSTRAPARRPSGPGTSAGSPPRGRAAARSARPSRLARPATLVSWPVDTFSTPVTGDSAGRGERRARRRTRARSRASARRRRRSSRCGPPARRR